MRVRNKTNVKIGDIIYHITGAKHEVLAIDDAQEYPVRLKEVNTGTIIHVNLSPNQYGIWEWYLVKPKGEKVNAAYLILRPDIKLDQIINVYDYNKTMWTKRYFAGWSDDGDCLVFRNGASSLTTNREPAKASMWCTDEDLEKTKALQRAKKRS